MHHRCADVPLQSDFVGVPWLRATPSTHEQTVVLRIDVTMLRRMLHQGEILPTDEYYLEVHRSGRWAHGTILEAFTVRIGDMRYDQNDTAADASSLLLDSSLTDATKHGPSSAGGGGGDLGKLKKDMTKQFDQKLDQQKQELEQQLKALMMLTQQQSHHHVVVPSAAAASANQNKKKETATAEKSVKPTTTTATVPAEAPPTVTSKAKKGRGTGGGGQAELPPLPDSTTRKLGKKRKGDPYQLHSATVVPSYMMMQGEENFDEDDDEDDDESAQPPQHEEEDDDDDFGSLLRDLKSGGGLGSVEDDEEDVFAACVAGFDTEDVEL